MPLIKKVLTPRDRRLVEAFLANPAQAPGTLTFRETQGFLFAVACAPELVRPSEWIPQVFGGTEPAVESMAEARRVFPLLLALFNEVSANAQGGTACLPADCAFRDELMANLEPDAPISQWSRGFVRGHTWLKEAWDAHPVEDGEDKMGTLLAVLSFFASPRLATRLHKDLARRGSSLEDLAAAIREAHPVALAEYADIGVGIFKRRLAEEVKQRAAAGPAPPLASRRRRPSNGRP